MARSPYSFLCRTVIILGLILGALVLLWLANKLLPLPNNHNQEQATYVLIAGQRVKVKIASSEAERQQGLLGASSLAPNTGMLFMFLQLDRYGFHLHGMRFPLDLVWIRSNQIVDLSPNLPSAPAGAITQIYYPDTPVDSVLELPAGFITTHNVRVGEQLKVLNNDF